MTDKERFNKHEFDNIFIDDRKIARELVDFGFIYYKEIEKFINKINEKKIDINKINNLIYKNCPELLKEFPNAEDLTAFRDVRSFIKQGYWWGKEMIKCNDYDIEYFKNHGFGLQYFDKNRKIIEIMLPSTYELLKKYD